MLSIANDNTFLEETLGGIVQVDDFTRNLLKIHKIIQKEGQAQPIISCIARSDYMLDRYMLDDKRESTRVRQVEVNAIASGMSAHSFNASRMHQFLLSKYRVDLQEGTSIPENGSVKMIAQGIIDAFDTYGKPDSYVLMITEDISSNFTDQFGVELQVHLIRPDVRLVRQSFCGLPDKLKLGPNKELLLDNAKELAVVYFRYGYDPSNYFFEQSWDTRLLIERSRAIKCPSINFHLSGAKKFQQVLNNSSKLEKYLDARNAFRLAKTFAKFWSIEENTPAGEEGFKVGLSSAKKLVLKPQREGGGHNIFGNDVKPFLEGLSHSEERSQYILMEYINSPKEKNWLLLKDDGKYSDTTRLDLSEKLVSELGIYGSVVANGSDIISNRASGYLVRSKKYGTNEGGVASGFAGISSLLLLDESVEDKEFSIYFD